MVQIKATTNNPKHCNHPIVTTSLVIADTNKASAI
jgi:hypothetical protein